MTCLTRDEQRQAHSAGLIASTNLEAHLRNLKREILEGDTSKLSDFQQFVQYAPAEMKLRLIAFGPESPRRGMPERDEDEENKALCGNASLTV